MISLKKNIKGSTYKNFARIFLNIFETISIRGSFFAQMVFWGNIKFKEGYLIEADPELFQQIKQGANKTTVKYIQGNIFEVIKNSHENATFLSLSDVPSFLKGKTEETYLQEISPKIEQGSLIVVRGNLRVTKPFSDDYFILSDQYDELIKKETTQLWNIQIYKKN